MTYYPSMNPFSPDLPGYGVLGYGVGQEELLPQRRPTPLSPGELKLPIEPMLQRPQQVVERPKEAPAVTTQPSGQPGYTVQSPAQLQRAGGAASEEDRLASDLFFNKVVFSDTSDVISHKTPELYDSGYSVDFNDLKPEFKKQALAAYKDNGMSGMAPSRWDVNRLDPRQLPILFHMLSDKGIARLTKGISGR